MNTRNPNRHFRPTIHATVTPADYSRSDPAARTGIYNPNPEIQHAYHCAASRETSKMWAAAAPPYRRFFDDDVRSRLDKVFWNIPLLPKPLGMTEEEKKVYGALCCTKKQRLKLDQIDEARVKENQRQRELFQQQAKKPREIAVEKQRSEWSNRHDIPDFIIGEDLWRDIRDG
ncbi:hypothetical protein N7G274_000302 [Stereocaulon virgatum]|uniref:Uncharacterized protein n=1 Tax=Stereocaulon virgatum TaxID=373712 RepID=A0ABR4AUI0_9LECA